MLDKVITGLGMLLFVVLVGSFVPSEVLIILTIILATMI